MELSLAAVVVCGTFAAVPTPKESLSLKAQPIKAVYRIPGLGPQQLGEVPAMARRRGGKLTF